MRNRIFTAGLMAASLIACGPQDGNQPFDEGDSVATVTQSSSADDDFIDREPVQNAGRLAGELGKLSDDAAKIGKVLSAAGTYGQVALTALQMLGYLQSEADIEQARFDALHQHLDNLGVALVAVDLAIARDERLSNMQTAVNVVTLYANRFGGRPINELELLPSEAGELANARTFSQNAAQFATKISAHEGYFHEGVVNGDRCTGDRLDQWVYDVDCWKRYVSARPGPNGSIAYDWRLGTAEMLQLIAARLAIIGMTDPNFRYNGERMRELGQYWTDLQQYHKKMMEGIQCWGADGSPVRVGCVDIYTGLEVSTTFTEPSCQNPYNQTQCEARIAPYKERFKRALMTRLPLFQVRSMMDALALSMTTNDELTTNPRIRMSGTQNCLYSNANVYDYETDPLNPILVPDMWTAGIANCSNDVAQEWHYDRGSGQIKNAWGACLGQRSFDLNNPFYGKSLWVKACTDSGSEHWSYDPLTGVLENAFHTVLGAPPQWGSWELPQPAAELPGASVSQAWQSPPLENLALNKPSSQSSNLQGYDAYAYRANDGNTDGTFWAGSVSHTDAGFTGWGDSGWPGQYWFVDLGSERVVSSVKIFNRTDCCTERLSHYNILAYDAMQGIWKVVSDHSGDDASGTGFFNWPLAMVRTQYVMIAKTDENYLSLAEVQVMGF